MYNYSREMSRWTTRNSVMLSQILDGYIGTPDMVEIRKDYSKLKDCLNFADHGYKVLFTGSRSEGLDLPGSDNDYMREMNIKHGIAVTERGQAVPHSNCKTQFEMVTDNVHPAFAMLRLNTELVMPCIAESLREIRGVPFLSSYHLTVQHLRVCTHSGVKLQGPSLEHPPENSGDIEFDIVDSIHCPFWPSGASEWICRTRSNGWPSKDIMNKIVDFGFHLVPIGYPRSHMKTMEWRISFSIAEKYLVWSFNHIQIQMYAILKLILKEFIKPNCTPENFVLCSYFVKTFLFWKFEETDKSFWRIENFRECLTYLLSEFHKVLQHGILKHYFFPSFNLLGVKMMRDAQLELIQLYGMVVQFDVNIIGQCKTVKEAWEWFLNVNGHDHCSNCSHNLSIFRFVSTTEYMMKYVTVQPEIFESKTAIDALDTCTDTTTTALVSLFIRYYHLMQTVPRISEWSKSNKYIYSLTRLFHGLSVDITTGKLWTAILFLKKKEYSLAMHTVNKLLSCIPPYALYFAHQHVKSNREAQILYTDMFLNSELDFLQIGRKAWLFNFIVIENTMSILPAALQIELIHKAPGKLLSISPFVCAYFLMFLCYHGLRQYDNRDRSLRQLIDTAEDTNQFGCKCIQHHAYNITGHCLLLVGQTTRAREIFLKSFDLKMNSDGPTGNEYNSARYYLEQY